MVTEPAENVPPRTDPYEVCVKGNDKVIGYACPKCHMFCSPLIYACKWDDALAAAHRHAVECCSNRLCSECGVDMGPRKKVCWLACASCRHKLEATKERERFEAAAKITYADYEHDFLYWNDTYYDDIDLLLDACDYDEPPTYAWACYPVDFKLDAQRLVSDALEYGDHYEDAYDDIGSPAMDQLQVIVDAWCKHVAVRSWMPDHKRAVLLPTEP